MFLMEVTFLQYKFLFNLLIKKFINEQTWAKSSWFGFTIEKKKKGGFEKKTRLSKWYWILFALK